jgi:hypothetical protein
VFCDTYIPPFFLSEKHLKNDIVSQYLKENESM